MRTDRIERDPEGAGLNPTDPPRPTEGPRSPREILRTHWGALESRRRRATGTIVTIYLAEQQGIDPDDGGLYLVVCEEHGCCIQHETRAGARTLAVEPDGWCEDCRHGSVASASGPVVD